MGLGWGEEGGRGSGRCVSRYLALLKCSCPLSVSTPLLVWKVSARVENWVPLMSVVLPSSFAPLSFLSYLLFLFPLSADLWGQQGARAQDRLSAIVVIPGRGLCR